MSQSKTSYDANTGKSTARTRRERHDYYSDTDGVGKTVPEPACRSRSVGHSIDRREWREISYDERTLVFYRPCSWPECYPDGAPDATKTQTVIRSCHRPTVFHRPRQLSTSQRSAREWQSVTTITDLQEGDEVTWSDQSTPLTVIGTTANPAGEAHLEGREGGSYRIEGRPNKKRPQAVYPAIGIISGLRRVSTVDSRPKRSNEE